MNKETMDKLFDPFYTTKFIGRGLGMSSVHGIIRAHNGTIKISSEPARGSIVRIYFSAIDQPAPLQAKEVATTETWRGSSTVLLVDDEENVRNVVERMLEKLGFSVLTAQDGIEALELFRNNLDEIVCVLLDLTMPCMGGKECFIELRKIKKDVRVVIYSGYSENETAQRFVGKKITEFLQKPFKLATLRNTMMSALEKNNV